MSKKAAVLQAIQENPDRYLNGNYQELADRFGTSYQNVKVYACKYRKQKAKKEGAGKTSFKQHGEKAEYAFNTSRRITSLQDLVEACDIDLDAWEIERWICNKWEVGAKDAGKNVQVHPLFQVKVWLKPKGGKGYAELKLELVEEIRKYAPKYPNLYYPKQNDGHLLVMDPADIHIGKLCSAFETGDEYNTNIAVQRVKDGIAGILNKANGFHIDQILFVIGNDILHIDTPRSTTTSGTFQDSHLMWYDAFRIAVQLYRDAIERLVQVAPVTVHYNPSNHDYTNGFFLAQTIEAWFSGCKAVSFNTSTAHRKYFTYHQNLIGTTHNDGAKEQDLALLMAHEAADYWPKCKHRYVYTHHIHHKKSKDYMSVCVEALRSPSGTDSWHHRNGYQHAPKAVEGFIHHKAFGQIARITHLF